MGNAEIQAADEIWQAAKENAERELKELRSEIGAIREESKAIGALKKIDYDVAHNRMLKYAILYQVKKSKDYKKGGLTWEQFCEAVGENRSNTDKILNDMKPIYDDFSFKLVDFIGMPFAKIRFLGRTIQDDAARVDDGCLVIDGARIPLAPDNREDIEAAIDAMKETHAREIDMHMSTIRAKDRIMDEKERVIRNQEKNLDKLQKQLADKGFSKEEADFLKDLDRVENVLVGSILQLNPEAMLPKSAMTHHMRACYLETLDKCRRTICGFYDDADAMYGGGLGDDDEWQQPGLNIVRDN